MINVEIIKGHAGQILPCGWVTGNKEFTIGGLMYSSIIATLISLILFSFKECLFDYHKIVYILVT